MSMNIMENQKLPELVRKEQHYSIIVEELLEKKIRFLCSRLPQNEWSGTLFYLVTGKFEDGTLTIHAKDFMLQDVGTAGFTSFKNDENIMAFMVENDLLDCYCGLMHSHDLMSTFFSRTDLGTLRSEGNDTNHFVSLIVNNDGNYSAAITRKVKYKNDIQSKGSKSVSYGTFGGGEISNVTPVDIKDETEKVVVEYYPLDITIENKSLASLSNKLEELKRSQTSYVNSREGTVPSVGVAINKTTTIAPPPPAADTLENRKLTKQPTLFDGQEDNPFAENTIPEAVLKKIIIPQGLVEDSVKQIIGGSVFSSFSPKFDVKKWGENMKAVYDKRFGKIEFFEPYADMFIEFLAEDILSEDLPQSTLEVIDTYDKEPVQKVWAEDVIDMLGELPTNPYIEYYINVLTTYLDD